MPVRLLRPSIVRLSLFALVLLAGCTWDDRPDGSAAVHSDGDGYYDDRYDAGVDATIDVPVVDPVLGDEALPTVDDAPVPLDQPVPTTGPLDTTTETEEALTPGTEQ